MKRSLRRRAIVSASAKGGMRYAFGILGMAMAGAALLVQAAPARVGVGDKVPPLRSTIVEGLSMGGVAIGMTQGETEALWGKPKQINCHGHAGMQPPGYPAYEYGGLACGWGGGIPRFGVIRALFAPAGDEYRVVELGLGWGDGRKSPKYPGWKTSKAIGVGSPLAGLKRAYGGRLRHVPPRAPSPIPERVFFVSTKRGATKWVTVFYVPTAQTNGPQYSYLADRVIGIDIVSAAALRQAYKGFARPGWRP